MVCRILEIYNILNQNNKENSELTEAPQLLYPVASFPSVIDRWLTFQIML